MNSSVFLWGWDGSTQWLKVRVDNDGHLQVDTLSSALPTGAATETTLDLVRAELDGIETLLAGGLPAALDAGALKVKEQSPITGYATSAKQDTMITALQLIDDLRNALGSVNTDDLQVDVKTSGLPTGAATSAKQDTIIGHVDGIETLLAGGLPSALDTDSLKVREQGTPTVLARAYDNAGTGIDAADITDDDEGIVGRKGLHTMSHVALYAAWNAVTLWRPCSAMGDASGGKYMGSVGIWGYDGTNYDRVRVSAAMSMMTKAEASSPTSSGPVNTPQLLHGYPAHGYAITVNKSFIAAAIVQLKDGLDATGAVLWEVRLAGLQPFSKNFWPWLGFSNGLYLDITGSVYSVVVEYGDAT